MTVFFSFLENQHYKVSSTRLTLPSSGDQNYTSKLDTTTQKKTCNKLVFDFVLQSKNEGVLLVSEVSVVL